MYSHCFTGAIDGIEGIVVNCEADVRNGLPGVKILGTQSKSVNESLDKVRVAAENSGYLLPPKHVTISFTPAKVKKEGTSYDLPVAIVLLAALGYFPDKHLDEYLIIGELSLNGEVKPVNGVLPSVFAAREKNILKILCPIDNVKEALICKGVTVYGVTNLNEACDVVSGHSDICGIQGTGTEIPDLNMNEIESPLLFSKAAQVNVMVLKALVIAFTGGHNIMLAGAGNDEKKILADYLKILIDKPREKEQLEILKLKSVLGINENDCNDMLYCDAANDDISEYIIKSFHKTMFIYNMEGMAQNKAGILIHAIRDNKAEYNSSLVLPAEIRFVAGVNLCKCKSFPDRDNCVCTGKEIRDSLKKINREIFDASDITVCCNQVSFEENTIIDGFEINSIREQVSKAVNIMKSRNPSGKSNARLTAEEIDKYGSVTKEAADILNELIKGDFYSIGDYLKCLRIARTVADLDFCVNIEPEHIKEAHKFLIPLRKMEVIAIGR